MQKYRTMQSAMLRIIANELATYQTHQYNHGYINATRIQNYDACLWFMHDWCCIFDVTLVLFLDVYVDHR